MVTLAPNNTSTALSTERIMSEAELESWLRGNMDKLWRVEWMLRGELERDALRAGQVGSVDEILQTCHGRLQTRVDLVRKHAPIVPDAHLRLRVVAKTILSEPSRFAMEAWHVQTKCGTSHCIAGWAQELAGQAGYDLTRPLDGRGLSHELVGAVLLGADAMEHFYDSRSQALVFLKQHDD